MPDFWYLGVSVVLLGSLSVVVCKMIRVKEGISNISNCVTSSYKLLFHLVGLSTHVNIIFVILFVTTCDTHQFFVAFRVVLRKLIRLTGGKSDMIYCRTSRYKLLRHIVVKRVAYVCGKRRF